MSVDEQVSTAVDFGYVSLWDTVAATVPDRECIVQGRRRQTWQDTRQRTIHLASWLAGQGLGAREGTTQPWDCPNDRVGVLSRNCPEALEAILASYRARCAPFNINYRYRSRELAHLLDDAAPAVLIYQREFAPVLTEALRHTTASTPALVYIDDDSGQRPVPGSEAYESLASAEQHPATLPEPSPDDTHLLYTGGTTGMPKGVIWRQRELIPGPCGVRISSLEQAATAAPRRSWLRALPAPPLMHGTALWYAFATFSNGGTVVLDDGTRHFDAGEMLETCRAERVSSLAIVGDVFAKPLLDSLDSLDSGTAPPEHLRFLFSSGAVLSEDSRARLTAYFPQVTIINALGSSETGPQAIQNSAGGGEFILGPHTVVVAETLDALLSPEHPGAGFLSNGGPLPRGYFRDKDRTTGTFREIDGRRLIVSGDRAAIDTAGHVTFLGRDSTVINSGGEKVYAEEVEAVLLSAEGVEDALVLGRAHLRWGQEVVALLVPRDGELDEQSLRARCAERLAGYKIPKAFLPTQRIRRFENGKPDYVWARAAVTGDEPRRN
jgi:fatty-acyl-CoA synthase